MWKDIEINPNYEISDTGIVRRKDNQNVLSGRIVKGYRVVKLRFDNNKKRSFYVHRLVALHFITNLDKKKNFVNHINGNKLDNRVENLEWISQREYNLRCYRQVQKEKRERKKNKPIPIIQYNLDGEEIARFDSVKKAKLATGIPVVEIMKCLRDEIQQINGYVFERQ